MHIYLNDETRHLISRPQFAVMKPSAYLINCARGGVVDEAALIEALQQKRLAGAGLDVFEKEPVDPDNPLLKMDNVSLTNHYASYSEVGVGARTDAARRGSRAHRQRHVADVADQSRRAARGPAARTGPVVGGVCARADGRTASVVHGPLSPCGRGSG